MTDLAIAWRDEQIEMLKNNLRGMAARIEALQETLAAETERANRAETALHNLREEIAECRPTT